MKMGHGWAIAALAVAALGASPVQAQAGGCENGRGGLMTDLGFRRLPLPAGPHAAPSGFRTEPRITGVRADGPAAGRLQDGDLLVAVDGQPVTTPAGARRYFETEPGRAVRLSVRRDGGVREVTVTAAEICIPHASAPPHAPPAPLPAPDDLLPVARFGFTIDCQDCGDDESGRFRFRQPPVVGGVQPGSAAARAGLRPGDRLTHVDGVALTSEAGWPRFSGIRPGQQVRFTFTRGGQSQQATLTAR
jgi:S1-C subfamily serine protease